MSPSAPARPSYTAVLADLDILAHLAPLGAVVIGTPPLGLEMPESDIDIACCAPNRRDFAAVLRGGFGAREGFMLRLRKIRGTPATVCRFAHLGWRVEIFGQAIPVERQYGVRHFRLERRLLALFGTAFKDRIIALRHRGLKTEPAFAELLGLAGDPFEALLDLEDLDHQALSALRAAVAFGGRSAH